MSAVSPLRMILCRSQLFVNMMIRWYCIVAAATIIAAKKRITITIIIAVDDKFVSNGWSFTMIFTMLPLLKPRGTVVVGGGSLLRRIGSSIKKKQHVLSILSASSSSSSSSLLSLLLSSSYNQYYASSFPGWYRYNNDKILLFSILFAVLFIELLVCWWFVSFF